MILYLLELEKKGEDFISFKESYTGIEVLISKVSFKKKIPKNVVAFYRNELTPGTILKPLPVKEKIFSDLMMRLKIWKKMEKNDSNLARKFIEKGIVYKFQLNEWFQQSWLKQKEITLIESILNEDNKPAKLEFIIKFINLSQLEAIEKIQSTVTLWRTQGQVYYLGGAFYKVIPVDPNITHKSFINKTFVETGVQIEIQRT